MYLPTLALSSFCKGNDAQRGEFARDLLGSLNQSGFVKVSDHGISDATVLKLFELVGYLHTWCSGFYRITHF